MRRFAVVIFVLAWAIGMLGPRRALAAPAASACAPVVDLPVPHAEGPSEREPARILPIGGYTLALTWMLERCRKGDAAGCRTWSTVAAGRPTSGRPRRAADRDKADLSLHGLWPDGRGKDWPQYCRAADPLPAATIAAHICATPSAQLLQHEWAKHGTCMAGYTPDAYFDLSNRLYAALRAPNLRALSYRRQTVASIARAFAAANPGMTAAMLRLNVGKTGWLEEVWICLDTDFHPRRCPAARGGAAGGERVTIWRGGAGASAGAAAADARPGYPSRRRYGRASGDPPPSPGT